MTERDAPEDRNSSSSLAKRLLAMREHLRHEKADGVDLGTLSVAAETLANLADHNAELEAALHGILEAETYSVHVGFDGAVGGGNFVYADAVRTDDESFVRARAALEERNAPGGE